MTDARGAPIPVRLLWLHVRSRALGTQGATVVVVATLSLLLHARVQGGLAARTTALALPLLPSLIVGTCFHAPARQVGRTVPASTPLLELVHATAYAVASGLALAAPATLVGSSAEPFDLLGNLAGFCGLALLAAAVLDPRHAWASPLVYGLAVLLPLAQDPNRLQDLAPHPWLWPVLPASVPAAAASELALLLVGSAVLAAVRLGADGRWRGAAGRHDG